MMRIKRICGVFFSPCKNVKKIIQTMSDYASEILDVKVEYIDFTLPEARDRKYLFDKEDLVFFGTPVYAGRVPNKMMPYIKESFFGENTPVVPVVSFGNRSFDDALMELYLMLRQNHFQTVAAAAVVSEHSFSGLLAAGRPNEEDIGEIREFAQEVVRRIRLYEELPDNIEIEVPGDPSLAAYYTPLGTDGKPAKFLKAVPKTAPELCDRCNKCAGVCPMGSIDLNDTAKITGICIKCHACIHSCKNHAKYFDDEAFLSHRSMLEKEYRRSTTSTFLVGI